MVGKLMNEDKPIVSEYDDQYAKLSVDELMILCKEENPTAIYELSVRYRKGIGGVRADVAKAVRLMQRVLKYQRHLDAMYFLGRAYENGGMGEENSAEYVAYFKEAVDSWYTKGYISLKENNVDEAEKWLTKAAEGGHQQAAQMLEQLSEPSKSLKEEQNILSLDINSIRNSSLPLILEYDDRYDKTDITELSALCVSGDPIAQYELGSRYRCGVDGVDKNEEKAIQLYFNVLNKHRNALAVRYIGSAYLNEVFGIEHKPLAVEWFKLASVWGNGSATEELGLLYFEGEIVEQDLDTAIELFKKAVHQGNKHAYFNLGDSYRVKKDYKKAKYFLEKSIEEAKVYFAYIFLAQFYENGTGVAKDESKAYHLYNLAYQHDIKADGAYYMARMYFDGRGVPEDNAKAYRLFREALDLGVDEANYFLGLLNYLGEDESPVVEKNADIALRYLSAVPEHMLGIANERQGYICVKEGRIEEAKTYYKKAVEFGNEEAVKIFEQLSVQGKSLQELAEEGSDPEAMLKYAGMVISDTENGGIHKAVEIITRAQQLYPSNLDVKVMYARIMFLYGHIENKIGAYDQSFVTLKKCVETIDILKQKAYKADEYRCIEIDACMECGEIAWKKNDNELALSLLARTDWHKYPYAVVLTALIHCVNLSEYAGCVHDDIAMINRALDANNWREDGEKASAYLVLSIMYATGIPGILSANVKYAYECIQRCAQIDPVLAENELKKYSKGFLGKMTYRI